MEAELSAIYHGEMGKRPIDVISQRAREQQIARRAKALEAITEALADEFGSPLTPDFWIPETNLGNQIGTGDSRYIRVLFEERKRPVCFRPGTTVEELVIQLAGPAPTS